jgi:WD40 repeat protein
MIGGVGAMMPSVGAGAGAAQPAFAVTRGARIYLLGADGTILRRLRSALRISSDASESPSWSPDGGRIVFSTPEAERGRSVRVINVDGSGERRLTARSSLALSPRFSPDGGSIAFTTGNEETGVFAITVMRSDGTAARTLTRGVDFSPTWSPDGTKIAFTRLVPDRRQTPHAYVYAMNADGSGLRRLATEAQSPAWSPDGTRIAFASNRNVDQRRCPEDICIFPGDIYVMNADGTGERRITHNSADDAEPTWSPDGRQIAFSSDRSYQRGQESMELYAMDSNGACIRRLTNTSAATSEVTWRPSSEDVATDHCGGVFPPAQRPLADTDLTQAKRFKQLPLFYLGPMHRGLLLTDASPGDGFTFAYDDCGRVVPSSCRDPIEVQVESVCQRTPLFFEPEIAQGERLPAMRTRRGALAVRFGSGLVDLYTGPVAIELTTNGRDATRAIDALQPVNGPARTALPPPVFPRDAVRTLREASRLRRQLGSNAAVGRRLGVSRAQVRLRLQLARALRRFGPLRSTNC